MGHDCSLPFSPFRKQRYRSCHSIMKVFFFILFLFLASASGSEYDDEEDVKIFLRGLKGILRSRSAHVCSDKMFTVNEEEFILLFNDAQCSEDRLRGNILRVKTDGSILTKDGKTLLSGGNMEIDPDIFDLIFPGFEQKRTTTSTGPTPAGLTTEPAESDPDPDIKTNSGNLAGLSYFIATLLFLVQMIY